MSCRSRSSSSTPSASVAGGGPDGELRVSRQPYLLGRDDVEWRVEPVGDRPRDRQPAPGDGEHEVRIDAAFRESVGEPFAGVGAVVEHTGASLDGGKNTDPRRSTTDRTADAGWYLQWATPRCRRRTKTLRRTGRRTHSLDTTKILACRPCETRTNRGISTTRNRGIQAAEGEFVCQLDDDRLAPRDGGKAGRRSLLEVPEVREPSGNLVGGGRLGVVVGL